MVVQPKSIYSVPRKLDLSSLFVFTTVYGLLFALMKSFFLGPSGFAIVAGFFTSIGLAQAIMFEGKSPRLASSLTGAIYIACCFIRGTQYGIMSIGADSRTIGLIVLTMIGALLGYLFGACIGGIFLVTDRLRNWLEAAKSQGQDPTHDDFG